MSKLIDICVQVDPSYGSPHVIIKTDKRSPLIDKLIDAIERCTEDEDPDVVCYSDDTVVFLNAEDISRIYSENRKVMICSDGIAGSAHTEHISKVLTLDDLFD